MSRVASLPYRMPVPLVALGVLVVGAGVLLQKGGVDLPAMLGSTTAFGVMARLGGCIMLSGLALFALTQVFGDPRLDRRLRNLGTDLPAQVVRSRGGPATARLPAVTAQQMASWQMRLATRAVLPPDEAPVPEWRLGQRLHRAAIAIIAGAFTTLLALTLWHQIVT